MHNAYYVPSPALRDIFFLLEQGSANFCVQVQRFDILGPLGPIPSVATPLLFSGCAKTAIDNMETAVQGWFQQNCICKTGGSLQLTPALDY